MEQVVTLCNDALRYPQNFADQDALEYKLASYLEQLNEHQRRLFSTENEASLAFRDLDSDGRAFWSIQVKSADTLRSHLRITSRCRRADPRCRFLFVHAPHSRESLKTSREMLMTAFTYLQVMPEFLDFLFVFGKQAHAQDLYCSGFRQRTCVARSNMGLKVPELGWSGHEMQVCYSLKSVERSGSQRDWPWSIRHCAAHHSFDMENTRSTWIIVKGDQLMERRVQSATSDHGPLGLSSFQSIDKAFAAALATHLLLCDWSAENWRWYIKFLEERLQEMTRGTININADVPRSPIVEIDTFGTLPRQMTNQTHRTAKSSFSRFSRTQTQTNENIEMTVGQPQPPSSQTYTNPGGLKQPLPPGYTTSESQAPKPQAIRYESYGQQQFSFNDLQKIQDIEEKTNETALVIKLNLNVMSQLRNHYRSIVKSQDFPQNLGRRCKGDLACFGRRIDGIEGDMQSQILRVEALLRLLADRKTLLRSLLDFQNMQANSVLADQSRKSTKNMEHLTHDMSEVARKTKSETVSMKIITLVTLFFLPGTFISVGCFFIFLTLMSTDIVHWDTGNDGKSVKNFQLGALQVYLAISLPFMLATFGIWYGFHWLESHKEALEKAKIQAKIAQP